MSRTVRVGTTDHKRDFFSTPIGYAFDAYEKIGPQAWSMLMPRVRLGSFVKELTEKPGEAIKPTSLLLDLGMAFDVSALDAPPDLECVHGRLPTSELLLDAALTALHATATTASGGVAKLALLHLAAMAQMIEHLDPIRQTYWQRCKSVWRGMQQAEWVASDYYYAYLAHNKWLAQQERERYLYPKRAGPHVPRATSDDFVGMRRALSTLNHAYKNAEIDAVKREQFVVQAVSLGLCVLAIHAALREGRLIPEPQDMQRLAVATGLTTQAAQNTADAMTRYLDAVSRHAADYPILTLLGPRKVRTDGYSDLAKNIDEAVDDARNAIDHLMTEGARKFVIPDTYQNLHSMTPHALAKLVAEGSAVSVWKVPFFLERAIQILPEENARDVDQVMALAATLESEGAIKSSLALGGIEIAMMAAPIAGPIGVGVAVAWGLVGVIRSVQEYRQLSWLFEASIDPHYLLRGLEHEPASKLGVLLSFLGMIVL